MLGATPDQSMGSRTRQQIDQEVLDQMVLSAYSNMVLIKVPNYQEERKTKSGIILDVNPHIQYFDDGTGSHMADHEKVVGIVEKVPPALLPDGDLLPWHTEMELKVGDRVLFCYFDSINSTSFVCGSDEYRLLNYSSIYLALRNVEPWGDDSYWEQILCLNGYCTFKEVMEEPDGFSELKVDPTRGMVHMTAIPVEYTDSDYTDDIDLKPGDIVKFRQKASRVFLERAPHFQTLSDKLFRHQRRDVEFVFNK